MQLYVSSLPPGGEIARLIARLFRHAKVLLFVSTFAILLAANGAAAPVNSLCPVTTDEPVDSAITITYQGQEIAFCCQKCRRQFLADPQKFASQLNAVTAATSDDGHGSHDHTHGHHLTAVDSVRSDSVTTVGLDRLDTATAAAHDHARDHGTSNRVINYTGKYHPVVVHFPIALLVTALLVMVVGLLRPSPTLELLAYRLVYLAAAGAVLGALLGLAAGADVNYPSDMNEYFELHRLFGLGTTALSVLVAFAAYRAERVSTSGRRWLFRIFLVLSAAAVAIAAHLGATLVYGPDHFAF